MGIEAALIASTVLAAGSAVQQQKAQKKAANAQKDAEMQARKIQAEQKPMEETATLGFGTKEDTLDTLGLVINPDLEKRKKNAGLGSTTTQAGLGGGITSSLGFGG